MDIKFAGMTLEAIVEQHSEMLIRIAYQQAKNITEAEDIVQETYLKLMKHKGAFKSEAHLRAWLIRVTINQCKDYLKSARHRRNVALTEDMTFMAPEAQEVMAELFQLPPMDRTIVYLHYYEGYKLAEIGRMIGKNTNTVSTRLRRARQTLKHIILEGSL